MLQVEGGEVAACKEQHQLIAMVRKAFAEEAICVDEAQLEKYLSQVKYFPYAELFPWEQFVLGLHCCTYRKEDGMPRWPDALVLMGRGGGKDGFIAFESFCLIGPYNGIRGYDVDICANSEQQAKAPFEDVHEMLESPGQTAKLKRFFYWNKEDIVCVKTKSRMKYRTNNPKGKDGLRSGIVVFNEIHQYQDYQNINVFTTGLGKKPHPRRMWATTDGDVRDGPLDDLKSRAADILEGKLPDNGFLPFICKLDAYDEVHDRTKWEKANPSLPYLPHLREEIGKEYEDWKVNPSTFTAFMTKRMNVPDSNTEIAVTSWENITACCQHLPNLDGATGIVGIDYAKVTDFASVGILITKNNKRYWITHSWLCLNSLDIPRMKCPWREWARQGLLTTVDDVEINPALLVEWIAQQATRYNLVKVALDNFRYALIQRSLTDIGFSWRDHKNVKLVRPSDIMIVSPIIERAFVNHDFVFGDNPLMRWAINNTKMIRTGINKDTGNMTYGKIEGKSRKNDPFMAMVAAMTCEPEIAQLADQTALDGFGIWSM